MSILRAKQLGEANVVWDSLCNKKKKKDKKIF